MKRPWRHRARAARWLAVIAAVALSACATGVRSRGFEPTTSTEAALGDALGPRRIAFVVGVDAYQDGAWGELRHAVADANALAKRLVADGDGRFDEVILLNEPKDVTRDRLLSELRRVGRDLSDGDTFVFYFSGHGTLAIDARGAPVYYLVAGDTRQDALPWTGVELSTLLAFIADLPPRQKAILFDSCFSGEGRSRISADAATRLSEAGLPWLTPPGGADRADALLMAAGLGGAAQEDDALGHGLYTWALLQALGPEQRQADANGDGAITAYEAHDHARQVVAERTGGAQTPEGFFRVGGQGDVFLTGEPQGGGAEQARIYGYGAGPQLALSVDGRPRGAFPRTIPVEAGRHTLSVSDGEQEIASAAVRLSPGDVYEIDALITTLRRPTWSASAMTGAALQLQGLGGLLWGEALPQVSVGVGHRSRPLHPRRLGPGLPATWLGVEVGLGPGSRPVASVAAEAGLRRGVGSLDLGVGAVGQLLRVSPDASAEAGVDPRLAQGWWIPEVGVGLWQGWLLGDGWELGLRQGLMVFSGESILPSTTPSGSPLNLRVQLMAGVRRGW